jgi:type I restriction enzyme S subunit
MSFPRYPNYKPSGVEWLGDVPEHWDVVPPKLRARARAGGTLIKGQCADEWAEGLFPGFSASGQDVWLEVPAYEGAAIVLSAVGARCGKSFKADGAWGVVANTHCIFPREGADRNFLWYVTNEESWWEKGGSAQPFVKVNETLARKWAFPPADEQQAIAAFLDSETAKIDALVAEQERLIELLKEKRQAVISHAVTKGLNPDVSMKDSGIEWLGRVPAHWEVVGLTKYLQSVVDYRGRTPTKVDDGVFLVTARNIRNGAIDYSASEEFIAAAEYETVMSRGKPLVGDVLFTTEAPLGQVANIDRIDIALAQRIIKFRGETERVDNYFLKYWLMGSFAQADMEQLATGSTALGIKGSKVGQLRLCLPPVAEQRAIGAFLDGRLSRFDALMAEARRAVDLLGERRAALISAAVTGQIDVRPESMRTAA